MTEFTKADAERLAAFLHGIRPDWYGTETVKALSEAARAKSWASAYTIAIAAIRCASDPANGTPARIPLAGEHWALWPNDSSPPTPTPPPAYTCRRCGAYVVPGEDHDEHCARRATQDTYARGAAAARQALHTARATTPQEDGHERRTDDPVHPRAY